MGVYKPCVTKDVEKVENEKAAFCSPRKRKYLGFAAALVSCLMITAALLIMIFGQIKWKNLVQRFNVFPSVSNDAWFYYKDSEYLLSEKSLTWADCRKYCGAKRADLVIVNSGEENDFIGRFPYSWIGLSKEKAVWKWVDGSALSRSFWVRGEPNNPVGDKHCAAAKAGGWIYTYCDRQSACMCEKKN